MCISTDIVDAFADYEAFENGNGVGRGEEQILISILRLLICFQIKMLTAAMALPFEKSIEAGKVLKVI